MLAKITSILFGVLLFGNLSYAQDIIHLRNGDVLEVKVVEIGLNDITYTELNAPDLQITLTQSRIEEIIMENGNRYAFETDPLSIQTVDFSQQRNEALKIGFLTPVSGSFRVEYDRNITPGQNLFASVNFIGVGFDFEDVNPAGLGASCGYKFMTSPEYYLENQKRAHIMMGSYVMIEAMLSSFGRDYDYGYYDDNSMYQKGTGRAVNTGGALILSYGKQYVMGNRFVMDLSAGIGYSHVSQSFRSVPDRAKEGIDPDDIIKGQMYNFLHISNEVPICFKTRLSIGLLL